MKFPEKESDFKCVTSLTPTVCRLCGVRTPAQCSADPIQEVLDAAAAKLGPDRKIERMLIFAPDACGIQLWDRFPEKLPELEAVTDVRVPIRVVMPSVTPVCFASMYSGALPEVHGIKQYAKPVLTCETLFNVFPEAGWKTSIAAVNQCSIDTIFRRRPITYISTTSDADAVNFTEVMLRNFKYDFQLCYATDYDSIMHHTALFAPEAVTAFNTNVSVFLRLSALIDEVWADFNRLLIFSPDHGAHNAPNGHGTHGADIPEDLLVYHFYAIRKGRH